MILKLWIVLWAEEGRVCKTVKGTFVCLSTTYFWYQPHDVSKERKKTGIKTDSQGSRASKRGRFDVELNVTSQIKTQMIYRKTSCTPPSFLMYLTINQAMILFNSYWFVRRQLLTTAMSFSRENNPTFLKTCVFDNDQKRKFGIRAAITVPALIIDVPVALANIYLTKNWQLSVSTDVDKIW